jgi:hypothetical protein
MCIARCRELELRYAPTLVEKIDIVYHAQDAVAELLVVCAGQQTNKSLPDNAND